MVVRVVFQDLEGRATLAIAHGSQLFQYLRAYLASDSETVPASGGERTDGARVVWDDGVETVDNTNLAYPFRACQDEEPGGVVASDGDPGSAGFGVGKGEDAEGYVSGGVRRGHGNGGGGQSRMERREYAELREREAVL